MDFSEMELKKYYNTTDYNFCFIEQKPGVDIHGHVYIDEKNYSAVFNDNESK